MRKYIKGALGIRYHAVCPDCQYPNDEEYVDCHNCGKNLQIDFFNIQIPKDQRFGWLLNERKWHDDIRQRKKAPDGSIVRVKHGTKPKWEK